MSREVIIVKWCDKCQRAEDVKVEAAAVIIVGSGDLPTAPRYQMDLCTGCFNTPMTPAELLEQASMYGTTPGREDEQPPRSSKARVAVGAAEANAARVPCPGCPETFSTPQALRGHIYSKHLGVPVPPAPLRCPDCTFRPPKHLSDKRSKTVSVAMHRKSEHGHSAVSDALAAFTAMTGEPVQAAPPRKRRAPRATPASAESPALPLEDEQEAAAAS